MKISLIIYPSTESLIVKWPTVPRIGETVWHNKNKFEVYDVWHSIDLNEIKVFIKVKR